MAALLAARARVARGTHLDVETPSIHHPRDADPATNEETLAVTTAWVKAA